MPSRLQIGLPTGVTFAPLSSAASNLSFRPAVLADTDRVVALVESAYRGDSSRAGWTTEADLLDGQRTDAEEVATLIGRDGSIILLAERHGRPVGCCHLDHHDASTAYFGMFAVEPQQQGGGVGRALLAEARLVATGWGCARIRMTVIRQRSDLVAWYGRLGFEPTGETKPFPYGNDRYGRPRRQDLEFVVLEGDVEP